MKKDLITNQGCFKLNCPAREHLSTLYLIDTEKEKRMGIGRDWDYPALSVGYPFINH